MQRLIYKWEDNSICLWDRVPFILSNLDLGSAERTNYANKKWGSHGVSLLGHFTGPRKIKAKCTLLCKNEEELFLFRRQASRVLNPGNDGALYYFNGFKEYKIGASVNASIVFENFMGNRRGQFFTVDFYCPNPLFTELEEKVKDFQEVTPHLKFPLAIKKGFIFSGLAGGDTRIINGGDAPCPVRIEITGPVRNPVVENKTTNQWIKIEYDLQEKEKIIVTTNFADKKVLIYENNGVSFNGFHYIHPETVFFNLAEGENKMKFYADLGYDKARCRIYYSPGYFSL